jgi:hypothetical protein
VPASDDWKVWALVITTPHYKNTLTNRSVTDRPEIAFNFSEQIQQSHKSAFGVVPGEHLLVGTQGWWPFPIGWAPCLNPRRAKCAEVFSKGRVASIDERLVR